MKTFTLLALMLISGYAVTEGTFGFPEEEDVVVLTDANFDDAIAKLDFVLVEFYAPWCGHCKKLAPEFSKAAATLKQLDTPIPLAKLDATESPEAAKKHGVQGYPTLKFFVKGSPIEFNGGRTADEIVNWIKKKTGPPTDLIADREALTAAEGANKVFVVYFTAGQESTSGFDAFRQIAMKHDSIPFFHVDNEETFKELGSNSQRVAIFTQHSGEYQWLEADQALTADNIENHITANRFPLVMEFEGDDAIARIFQGERDTMFFFSDKADHEFVETFKTLAKSDAVNTEKPLIFSTSKLTEGLGQRLSDFVGAKASDGESLWIVRPGQNLEKYRFSGDMTVEAITEFINSWRTGSIEKHLKSADVPASNDEPVKIVVGKNFDQVVTNNDKWVLLEFYAPWCGHCKTLAPIYDELAKKLSHMDNLVLAKIDATENEVPSVSVQGFPTLKLFAPGKKDTPMDFDSDRTLEGLEKALKEKMGSDFQDAPTDTDL